MYVLFFVLWIVLALGTWLLRLPAVATKPEDSFVNPLRQAPTPTLIMGFMGIFLYVGGEVSIGSFLVKFLSSPELGGLSLYTAGQCVALYWGAQMVGRFVGAVTLRKFVPAHVLLVHALAAVALIAVATTLSGSVAMVAILAVGFCNSIMFPTIFSLTVEALGRFNAKAAGILSIGCAGGALVPMLQAWMADSVGLQTSFVVPALCYVYIFVFARSFSRAKAGVLLA
jgi:FHS family L-fucose permease-like MFS transporter